MVHVCEIRTDYQFQSLSFDDMQFVDKYQFIGQAVAGRWNPPTFYVPYPTLPEPDFWGIIGGLFAVRPKLLNEHIGLHLHDSCEMLPIVVEGFAEKLIICHVINVVNCLDHNKSQINESNYVSTLVVNERRLGRTLFKIPESPVYTLCWMDDESGSEQSFMGEVMKCGYTGIRFRER